MGYPRVRFAPSPTGKLHLGSARTALFNWLFARHNKGKMILRLEDTDALRSSKDFERDITDSLTWMGLNWDEGPDIGGPYAPYRQSARLELYRKAAEGLLSDKKAYRCFCTPEELSERKQKTIAQGGTWRYDRKCLHLEEEGEKRLLEEGKPYAIRFLVPPGEITVKDLLRGDIKVDSKEIDDFIIVRSDGRASFHLAVVVDDISMKISHVIRGDDHLTNSFRHVLLFDALGSPVPQFLHHSLMVGVDGAKLSKRHGATSVSDYREAGYLPSALVNYLALLSWSPGDEREIFTLEELTEEFDVRGISASKAVFDIDKLNWLNRRHIQRLSTKEVVQALLPFLKKEGKTELLSLPEEKLEIAVESVRKNMQTLRDALEPLDIYAKPAGYLSPQAKSELEKTENVSEIMEICVSTLSSESSSDSETAQRIISTLRNKAKERGWSAKKVLWPLRLGMTGETIGPDLVYLIMFWGPKGAAERIKKNLGPFVNLDDKEGPRGNSE
ncbi:MAG: glutamate--tRNA ligase [Actinomycetota bacterium]|nr:glutamate--tRNA ligase [Actinomycetota bacterium]